MKTAIVKLSLHDFVVTAVPGETVRIYGYNFIVNQTKECICEMPVGTAEHEAAAGRVVIIKIYDDEELPPDPALPAGEIAAPIAGAFSNDMATWFGCGDAAAFRKKIAHLTKWQLIDFANDKLRMTLAPSLGKSRMVADICNAADQLAGVA